MKVWNLIVSFPNPFSCLWHSPLGISVHPHTMDYFINEKFNIDRNKQLNYNTGKIRQVNAQNKNHKNIYTVTIISHQLAPPSWGVLADRVCSSPPNLGHKHYSKTHIVGSLWMASGHPQAPPFWGPSSYLPR